MRNFEKGNIQFRLKGKTYVKILNLTEAFSCPDPHIVAEIARAGTSSLVGSVVYPVTSAVYNEMRPKTENATL